jgi:hypothetical protein
MKFFCTIGILLVTLMSGCAVKPSVATDYEASYNFSGLKSFTIKSTKQDTKDNILVSPFTLSHIHAQLHSELSAHYQSVAEAEQADFLVSYHLVMEEKLDPRSYDQMVGFGLWAPSYRYPSSLFYRSSFDTSVTVYNQGSLIVDMVDAKTQKPIWRGVSQKRINKALTPQQQRELLTKAIKEVLAQFPPAK